MTKPIQRPPKKPGRKEWITPEVINDIENWAARGLSVGQIIQNLPYQKDAYYRAKRLHPEIDDALKRGQAKGMARVQNALWEKAIEGNMTAIIFFLKNRDPDRWNDRNHLGNQPDRDITINVQAPAAPATPKTQKAS